MNNNLTRIEVQKIVDTLNAESAANNLKRVSKVAFDKRTSDFVILTIQS